MTDERDAIERLERRVAQVEDIVRKLLAQRIARRESTSVAAPLPGAEPVAAAVPRPVIAAPAVPRPAVDLEQWFGQKGLLAVGIFGLIATAGYLLKYAFDRGWISPSVRVTGGVVAGAIIAIVGERVLARGLRTYGASLIGAGGGLAYLALWAAAGPYALVARPAGVVLLAATTALAGWRAVRHRVEALAIWALLGAYLAPLFLPQPTARPENLLGYFAILAFGSGYVAYRMGWRTTFDLNVLGYFGLPAALGGQRFAPGIWMAYLSLGGAAALLATARTRWPEARVGAFVFSWSLLLGIDLPAGIERLRRIDLSAGAVLLLAALWPHRATSPFTGLVADPPRNGPTTSFMRRHMRGDAVGEALIFIASPMLFLLLAAWNRPALLAGWEGAVPAATAALYLGLGWRGRVAHFVGMGIALLGWAVAAQWDDVPVALGWAALGALGVAADRWLDQRGGRDVGVALLGCAFWNVFAVSQVDLAATHRPFVSQWSLGWYGVVAASAVAAVWWRARAGEVGWPTLGRPALWGLAGLGLLFGGTIELQHFFAASARPGATLAGKLAVSTYWLFYAAALVWAGFRLAKKPVRSAGLALAALASAKVVLVDLSNLEALYRVGSTFVLALIALGVAYAYNRRARAS